MRKEKEKPFSKERTAKKGRLDDNVLQYYRRVSVELDQNFEDEEHASTFFSNVFNQLCTEALPVSQNQTASNIVEALLKKASADHLLCFFKALRVDWEVACTDRFASHVTETLLLATHRVLRDVDANDDASSDLRVLLFEPFSLLCSNLGLYIQDTYASHILRTYVQILSCVQVPDSVVKSRIKADFSRDNAHKDEFIKEDVKPNEEHLKLFQQMTSQVIAFPTLKSYLVNSVSNPVIQTLMLALHVRDTELCDRLCSAIVQHCFGDQQAGDIVTDPSASHVVEQLLTVCSDALFDDLFHDHLKDHLVEWCTHPVANYIVQKLLLNFRSKELFEKAVRRIMPNLEEIFSKNCAGVIVNLAKGTVQHGTKQHKFLEHLMKAFHCYEPQERQSKLVQLVACMTSYDDMYKMPDVSDSSDSDEDSSTLIALPTLKSVSLQGSILVQTLLELENPRPVTSSLLDLSRAELKLMACDPRGSHIYDTFLNSSTVGEKSREHLLIKLKGTFVDLACNKCGSRVMDRIWEKATIKQKAAIAEELVSKEAKVQGDRFGSFIWLSCGLRNFKSRRKEWENFQSGANKKRKMFEDIISPDNNNDRRKKSKTDEGHSDGSKSLLQDDEEPHPSEAKRAQRPPARNIVKKQSEGFSKNKRDQNSKQTSTTMSKKNKQSKGPQSSSSVNNKQSKGPASSSSVNNTQKSTSKKKKRPSLKQRLQLKGITKDKSEKGLNNKATT